MKMMLGVITIILFVAHPSFADSEKGLEIARRIDQANSGWGDEKVSSTMILKSAEGKEVVRKVRNLSLEIEGDGDKTLAIFDTPLDVKGTIFLTYAHKAGNDDQWLYLPALKRTKRISSSNRSGPFMGSEFAYEDVSSEEVERYTYQFLRDEACAEGLECNVLERCPVDEHSGYSKQVVYADKQYYRIHKIEYYDRKDALLKTLTRLDYQKFGNIWRAAKWEMVNHQTHKSTLLIWEGRQFETGIKESDFSVHAMQQYR